MAFDISEIVNVTTTIEPSTSPAAFGKTLIFTSQSNPFGDSGVDRDARVKSFENNTDANIVNNASSLRDTIAAYFAQIPHPPTVKVGRIINSAVQGSIQGSSVTVSDVAGAIRSFTINETIVNTASLNDEITVTTNTSGGVAITGMQGNALDFIIEIGGVEHQITTDTTGAAETVSGIASKIEDAIQEEFGNNNITVTSQSLSSGDNGRWTINGLPAVRVVEIKSDTFGIFGDSPTISTSITKQIQDAINSTSTFSGVEVSATTVSNTYSNAGTMQLTVTGLGENLITLTGNDAQRIFGENRRITDGRSADGNITNALNRITDTDNVWHYIVPDPSFSLTQKNEIATWAAGTKDKQAIIDIVTSTSTDFTTDGNIAKTLADKNSDRVSLVWQGQQNYNAARVAAQFSAIDLSGAGVLRTAKFLTLQGSTPDIITTRDKNTFDEEGVNYYTIFGNTPVFGEGITTNSSRWMDQQYWLDWFVNTMQNQIFATLRRSIPQTSDGLATLQNTMEAVCQAGVVNGGIAPGRVTESTAGDVRRFTEGGFSGYLTTGYLVAIRPIDSQTQTQRAAREAPPSRVYLKGAGAFHSADIIVNFTQ